MQLILSEKKQDSSDVVSFLFNPQEPLLFKAGQFLRYKLNHPNPDDRGVTRFFTISSSPHENFIMLTTRLAKEKGSSFKEALKNLPIGGTIEAEGPKGKFVVEDASKEHVFIAGGIGITPFRSILLDLSARSLPLNVTLFYANRSSEVVFKDIFDSLAAKDLRFKICYVVDPQKLTIDYIAAHTKELLNVTYMISGPEPMVKAVEEGLVYRAVLTTNIIRDYFPGYQNI